MRKTLFLTLSAVLMLTLAPVRSLQESVEADGLNPPPNTAVDQDSPTAYVTDDGQVFEAGRPPPGYEFGVGSYSGTGEVDNPHSVNPMEPTSGANSDRVIGADGRTQVNSNKDPHRMVAFIETDEGRCTGWMFGERTLITAAHCVYNYDAQTWLRIKAVWLARNGSYMPFDPCYSVKRFTASRYRKYEERQHDYGAIKLNCPSRSTPIGRVSGWFGVYVNSYGLNGLPAIISGYPGDKPVATQWRAQGELMHGDAFELYYDTDMFRGQSGSPVYYNRGYRSDGSCPNWCVTAVSAYESEVCWNWGPRMTQSRYNTLWSWRNS